LEGTLDTFQDYYNHNRFHASLEGNTPAQVSDASKIGQADLERYRWQTHCRGLVQLPMAAQLRIRDPHPRANLKRRPGTQNQAQLHELLKYPAQVAARTAGIVPQLLMDI